MNGTRISPTKPPINTLDIRMLKFRPCAVEDNAGRKFNLNNNHSRQAQHDIPVELP